MKTSNLDLINYLQWLQDIAYEAGEIILKYQKQRQQLVVEDKGGGEGIASSADKEAETFILKKLKEKFPTHTYLSEESDFDRYKDNVSELLEKEYLWIIDPLDGTNNFVNGIPIFATSIGFMHKGETLLGIVYNPHSGECFFAGKDCGAFLIDFRINPLKKYRLENKENLKKMNECIFSPAPVYSFKDKFEQQLSVFKKNITGARAVRRLGSAALELCYVASGNFDAYWEKNLKPWDVAGAYLVCHEAGVQVTDFDGKAYSPFNESIIAAPEPIHGQILGKIG